MKQKNNGWQALVAQAVRDEPEPIDVEALIQGLARAPWPPARAKLFEAFAALFARPPALTACWTGAAVVTVTAGRLGWHWCDEIARWIQLGAGLAGGAS